MFDYNIINDMLNNEVVNFKPHELLYIQRIVDVVLKNDKNLIATKFKNHIEAYQSLKLVYKFLEELNPKYADIFKKATDKGRLKLDYDVDETGGSYYDEDEGKIMYVPINHNIHDSSTMVHELMHDINLEPDKLSATRFLFTEATSILGEMLYHDYLVEHNLYVHDARANLKETFWFASRRTKKTDFEIQLILNYLNEGFVNDGTIKSLTKYDNEYNFQVNYSLSEIVDEQNFGFYNDQKYVIGILFASYMYNRIKTDNKKIHELYAINEIMNDISFGELMLFLDLESHRHDEYLLTSESLEKLNKSYQKVLKNIG